MLKTTGFAVLFAAGVAAIVAYGAGTSASEPTAEVASEQRTTADGALSADTLTAADRLAIAYRRDTAAIAPAAPAALPPDETPPQPPAPAVPAKIDGPRAQNGRTGKPAPVAAGARTHDKAPRKIRHADRGKGAVEPRTCRPAVGFAALLKALNLAPGCTT